MSAKSVMFSNTATKMLRLYQIVFFPFFLLIIGLQFFVRMPRNIEHTHRHDPMAKMTPLNIFSCADYADCGHLSENILRGASHSASSRVVIAGTVRNKEKHIAHVKQQVELISSQFKEVAVLVVENDSKDNTRKELLAWRQDFPQLTVLGCGVNSEECEMDFPPTVGHPITNDRIRKMATLRNIYVDYITENYSDYDYLIVWDFDLLGSVYLDGIWSTFHHFKPDQDFPVTVGYTKNMTINAQDTTPFSSLNESLDAVCCVGLHRHHDKRNGTYWSYRDPFAHIELNQTYNDLKAHTVVTQRIMNDVKPGQPLHKLKTCFGGLAVYKLSSVLQNQARYDYSKNEEIVFCEHNYFHEDLNVYMNPSMIYAVIHND